MTEHRRTAADAIHHSTKHGTPAAHPERLVDYPRLHPANAPRPFKEYRGRTTVPLPRRLVPSTPPAVSVLSGGSGPASPLDAPLVATLLHLSAGVTRVAAGAGRPIFFRAAMSAGNLHPVEVYLVAGPDVDGITAGVHHFAPLDFGLTPLRSGDLRPVLGVSAPAALVLTGLVWRTTWKYGERGWRHLYWDGGAVLANLLAVAEAHGLVMRALTGFADEVVSRLVGIDGEGEVPLAVVVLGDDSGEVSAPSAELAPLSVDVAPVAADPVRLPLLVDAQAEGALAASEVVDWRRAAGALGTEVPHRIDPLPSVSDEPIEAVILRRGSTRLMRPEPVSLDRLLWPLAAAGRAVPLDVFPERTLLEQYVNVHAVRGLSPGAYRWAGGEVALVAGGDSVRETGELLCLNQPLGGDSAYTVFHHAALDPILDALGSRGYRVAQLEAGIASGRLALAAFAIGLGATGLTFYDDLVSRYFRTETAPMLVTAVGVSETPPVPGGLPGEPVRLRRYDRLMGRVSLDLQRARRRP